MGDRNFLFLEMATEHANQVALIAQLASATIQCGGVCFAYAAPGRVAGLEPGSVAAGMLVAKFADEEALARATTDVLLPLLGKTLPSDAVPLLLAVEGLPSMGLPDMMDIPTVASVPRPPREPRNAFLVVRGTGSDQQRLNAYRDVILPMHKERGGYYEVFALLADQVKVFSGVWNEQIFALSRWPTRSAAEDFWYCDRYQQQAIPLRLGAGRFTVHLLDAT